MTTWNNVNRNSSVFSNPSRKSSTFTPVARNSSAYSNIVRNSAVFVNASRSLLLFGDLTFDQIGAMTFDGIFQGKPIGDWTFDSLIGPVWVNYSRN